jgi:hypothetical protein
MKLQYHLHYTDFKMNHCSKSNINSSTKNMVDAEEKTNGHNVGSQEPKNN